MDRPDIREGTDALQDVGGMAEDIFDILRCGPGNAGEGTEGSGVAEIPVRGKIPTSNVRAEPETMTSQAMSGVAGRPSPLAKSLVEPQGI